MNELEENVDLKSFWTDEFAPKTIDDMVLVDETKNQIKSLLESKTRFNLLLAGSPGIGKSTLAKIISKTLNSHELFIKCGLEGNVDTAKTKLMNFCSAMSVDGRPKVVILDELDCASSSQENSFQKTLRNIISESPKVMFIGTCNYPEKVIPAIKSRLGAKDDSGIIKLSFTYKELGVRLNTILKTKNISYTKESLKDFAVKIMKSHYPDIRSIIDNLSKCCSSGSLVVPSSITSSTQSGFVKELVGVTLNSKDALEIRRFYTANKSKIDDYVTFASSVFNYLMDNGLITSNGRILKLVDILYQLNMVVDKETHFFGFLVAVGAKK